MELSQLPEYANMPMLLSFRKALGGRSLAWATRNMELPRETLADWVAYRRRLPPKYHRRIELFIDLYSGNP